MNELGALFVVVVVAVGLAIWEIRGHLDQVHAPLLERCDQLDKSIAELKRLIDR
jgi:hypothetical protein